MVEAADEDLIKFSDEDAADSALAMTRPPWVVLVVDDDASVHELTRLALRDFRFEGGSLKILSAYSGIEAKALVAAHPDAAMMLLDVVMEDDQTGLHVVRHVRDVLKNRNIRIVLRTGQPGSAPEQQIISDYDINDFKEKTELTSRKLFTLMHACLRGFRDICTIEENKRGLERIIESSANLFRIQNLDQLTEGVLQQLDALLNLSGSFFARAPGIGQCCAGGIAMIRESANHITVAAATGSFQGTTGRRAIDVLPEDALVKLQHAFEGHEGQYWDDKFIGVFRGAKAADRIVYLSGVSPLSDFDRHLIALFSRNVGISFENLLLREEVEATQRELVYRLGGAVETRSKETGGHVRRVAEMSYQLALLAGQMPQQAIILKHASPMHDVGKIGIPDAILNKPGRLTPDEWAVMQSHTLIGYEMFGSSSREILQMSGLISLEHHEKWDGSGYPHGKRGEEISLAGRLTAVVDVFDALLSPRCYKEAWPLERVLTEMRRSSGSHFDTTLLALMLDNLERFLAIRKRYADVVEAAPASLMPATFTPVKP
ncbi:MAG: DUF3369 domain-containing protein [Rhodoferax sp.]